MIRNLVNALKPAAKHIQEKMIELCTQCDPEYGKRLADGIRNAGPEITKGPIGTAHSGAAVKEAATVSGEAKPY